MARQLIKRVQKFEVDEKENTSTRFDVAETAGNRYSYIGVGFSGSEASDVFCRTNLGVGHYPFYWTEFEGKRKAGPSLWL